MKQYKDKIIEIFENYPVDSENKRPGIRWAFEPIKKEIKYLILGINPSNSVTKANLVIKKSGNIWSDGPFIDQYSYDKFLSDSNNESKILLLQELAHEHHLHFKKQKKFISFLKDIEENNFQFFDYH